jgi:hypothetical protein
MQDSTSSSITQTLAKQHAIEILMQYMNKAVLSSFCKPFPTYFRPQNEFFFDSFANFRCIGQASPGRAFLYVKRLVLQMIRKLKG